MRYFLIESTLRVGLPLGRADFGVCVECGIGIGLDRLAENKTNKQQPFHLLKYVPCKNKKKKQTKLLLIKNNNKTKQSE